MRPPHLTSTQRGTYYSDWGTPPEILDAVRSVLGPIALDMASSHEANKTVRATEYNTPDGRFVDPNTPYTGSVWCNPPGPGKEVHRFWVEWLLRTDLRGSGAFLFFNVDHMRKAEQPFFDCTVILLHKRLKFVGAPSQASFPSALVFAGDVRADARGLGVGHVMLWRGLEL